MVNTTYNSTEEKINILQTFKGKTKIKVYKNLSNCHDNMKIRMDEYPFAKIAQGIKKIYNEVILLMKFLQNKHQVKNMNNNYYELYYTVIENRDEKEIVYNQYEIDFIIFNDIVPNHYVGIKINNDVLRLRKLRS